MRALVGLGLALALAGCAYPGKSRVAGSELEKAIRFVEIDDRNRSFDLSDTGLVGPELIEATAPAGRVPDPRHIDLNSTVEIKIDKDRLRSGDPSSLTEARSQELLDRKELIKLSLQSLAKLVELRTAAVEAFAQLKRAEQAGEDVGEARKEFRQHRRGFAREESVAIQALLDAWRSDPAGFVRIDEAARDPSYEPLQRVLQEEIREIDRAHAALIEELADRELQLRLSVFLESGKQSTAVHLPGYDNLGRGEIQRRDRLGLDLSPEERVRLDANWEKTRDLARAAEEVRTGQRELREVFEEQVSIVAPELGAVLEAAKALEQRTREIDIDVLVEQTRRDLESLGEKIAEAAQELGAQATRRAAALPRAWADRVETIAAIHALVAEASEIADDWKRVDPERILGLVARSAELASRIAAQLEELKGLSAFHEGRTAFEDVVDEGLRGLELSAITQVKGLLDSDEILRLSHSLAELRQIWLAGEELFEALDELVGGLARPVLGEIEAPASLRVPIGDIEDTAFDLTRTGRREGDRFTLYAELYRGDEDKTLDQVEASFEPSYLGWHARLSPSVVLVRPSSLTGREEQFAFAPALSWVHGYRPRPEDEGFFDTVARGLDPSIGIHAAFVNFDPDTSIEIGLGATLSFWRERLQVGAGVNLMATTSDGRYYYFIGSDLISLLNTVGIGN